MKNILKNKNIYIIFSLILLLFIIYYFNKKNINTDQFDVSTTSAQKVLVNDPPISYELPQADLGPIAFFTKNIHDEKIILGKYPKGWTEQERIENGLTVTEIEIPRGPQGDKGEQGNTPHISLGNSINLEEIHSDNDLTINANNLNLNANSVNLNNSLCFDQGTDYCIDTEFITLLKDTNNLVEEKELLIKERDNEKTAKETCQSDLYSLQSDIDNDYFHKIRDVPSLYTLTQTCIQQKTALVDQYRDSMDQSTLQANYDTCISDKGGIQTILDGRDAEIGILENSLATCNTDLSNARGDYATTATSSYNQNAGTTQNCHTSHDPNLCDYSNYISNTQHAKILFDDYIPRSKIGSTLDSDYDKEYVPINYIDANFKDLYGNYLTNAHVAADYARKETKVAEIDLICQQRENEGHQYTTTTEQKLDNLRTLCGSEADENYKLYTDCVRDRTDNYFSHAHVAGNYKENASVEANYMLNSQCDNDKVNNFISKTIVESDYIKNDADFANTYILKTIYDTLNREKSAADSTIQQHEITIAHKNTIIDSHDDMTCPATTCPDCSLSSLQVDCNKDRNDCLIREQGLNSDLIKLGDFIISLYSNISAKEQEIAEISIAIEDNEDQQQQKTADLEQQVDAGQDREDEAINAIQSLQAQNSALTQLRTDALDVIKNLQIQVAEGEEAIDATQVLLQEKLKLLQTASTSIDKCTLLQADYNIKLDIISDLNKIIDDWKLSAIGTTATQAQINLLDEALRDAKWQAGLDADAARKDGIETGTSTTMRTYGYTLFDKIDERMRGLEQGTALAAGQWDKFLEAKCQGSFMEGVASKSEYIYTDADMKAEIDKITSSIGTRSCNPGQTT
tara:strand:- start:1271 stop:3838 length:2568 start_codon:yes stop_codon:yes gene_type:complete